MEMINGACLDLLPDVVIITRHHVDVLLVSWLLLVQSLDDKKLHGMTKVCLA
jgi:hypothetical protein